MKRVLMFTLALALILCGCASVAPAPAPEQEAPATQPTAEPEPEAAPEPVFDLDAYKSAVDQFRRDVMDNGTNLCNIANYEASYIKNLTNIRGSADSESTLESAQKWFEEKSESTFSDIETAHARIKEEYAALIITEIDGKEAEELDSYVRSMYEGYNDLYTAATTASPTSFDLFADIVNTAVKMIQDSNSNIGLFCGEYGE